MAGKH